MSEAFFICIQVTNEDFMRKFMSALISAVWTDPANPDRHQSTSDCIGQYL